jgi:hypothetical protein
MTAPIVLAFGVLLLLLAVLYVVVARPRINQWGATDQEHESTWPGDQLVDRPSFVWTNAITIKAPAAQVWPWLAQLGQGRGGLYSYDWLENLIGCDVHSTDRILPAFQTPLRVGDRVIRMARYAPHAPVAVFEPQRALVLGHIKDTYADLLAGRARSSWAFILQPIGQNSTRLLVRCRGNSLMARLLGPVQFVMQRKMMLGIKQRAEQSWLTPSRSDAEPPRPRLLAERRDLVLTDPARPLERRTRASRARVEVTGGPLAWSS